MAKRALVSVSCLMLAVMPARSQEIGAVAVPMTAQEQAVVLAMCDAATWAAKRQFDGVCEFFRTKFDNAVRDAKAKSDKEAQPAPNQPKE